VRLQWLDEIIVHMPVPSPGEYAYTAHVEKLVVSAKTIQIMKRGSIQRRWTRYKNINHDNSLAVSDQEPLGLRLVV
jgi:hypothetical protein